jgi:hypothetical protein
MRAPRYEHAFPVFVQPKRCTGPACTTIAISLPAFHHVWTQHRSRMLEPEPECETGHHVRISSWPRIEISKVEQKCPSKAYGPSQRVVNPYPKRDQPRGIISKKNPRERTQSRLAAPPWLVCRSPEDRSNTFLDRKTRPGSGPL